jgi:hypothetical protein
MEGSMASRQAEMVTMLKNRRLQIVQHANFSTIGPCVGIACSDNDDPYVEKDSLTKKNMRAPRIPSTMPLIIRCLPGLNLPPRLVLGF